MKGYKIYIINNEQLELPYFERGDRVRTYCEDGTVKRVTHGGLFVYVDWDDKSNGLGSCRLVNHLEAL